jgi:[ribosomal protein S18]-alanine N-acetyltransferase
MLTEAVLFFRAMEEADLNEVLEIEEGANTLPWTLQQIQECLEANYECWVCSLDAEFKSGAIIAYSLVSSVLDESSLLNLCVAVDHQRLGYGRVFLRHLLENAKSRGQAHIFLEVRASNTKAIQLYESFGFTQTGLRKDYYPTIVGTIAGREDAFTYVLNDLSSY